MWPNKKMNSFVGMDGQDKETTKQTLAQSVVKGDGTMLLGGRPGPVNNGRLHSTMGALGFLLWAPTCIGLEDQVERHPLSNTTCRFSL